MINRRMPFLAGPWLTGYFITTLTKRYSASLIIRRESFASSAFTSHQANPKIRKMSEKESRRLGTSNETSKPPNVLIYTGCQNGEDNFEMVKTGLQTALSSDSYAIYGLDNLKALGHPWSKNSTLLVIYNSGDIEEQITKEFELYLKSGGNVLSVGSGRQNHIKGLIENIELRPLKQGCKNCTIEVKTDRLAVEDGLMEASCEPFFFSDYNAQKVDVLATEKESEHPMIIFSTNKTSGIILSLVNLFDPAERSNHPTKKLLRGVLQKLNMKCVLNKAPQLTPALLFASTKHKQELMKCLEPHLVNGSCRGTKTTLVFCTDAMQLSTDTTEHTLPVVIDRKNDSNLFDWNKYSQYLKTHTLGRIVLFTEVIPSTQTLLEGNTTFVQSASKIAGLVAVTSQQVKGKGRGGNLWLSPAGCMMFSITVQVDFGTELGRRLPYIQHVASLALMHAVKGIPGYENIDIHLKWPNDIYYGKKIKIGGVVISSSALGNSLNAVIGMGVNLSNQEPTICINDIIKQYNHDNNTNLALLELEVLLARTINCMEELIDGFQVNGKDAFLVKYYSQWMHSGHRVTLNTGSTPEEVTIAGLDDYGFLMVEKNSGETHSVQPDGNTFDILANLIEIKT